MAPTAGKASSDARAAPSRCRAAVLGVLAFVSSGVVLIPVWGIAGLYLLWAAGGDFGGYGSGPTDPAGWYDPVVGATGILLLSVAGFIGTKTYRRALARHHQALAKGAGSSGPPQESSSGPADPR